MFRFNDPLVLLLLLTLPVIAWIRHRAEGRRTGAIRFSSVSAAREAAGITSGWAHRVPGILRAVALTALIVALARPQTGMTSEDVRTQGIDILLALDVSSSMLAEDLEPNRLSAAKSVAAEFVQGRGNDRIGLIAFAGKAFTQAPLTLDYGVVTELLGELEIGMIEDGTAVGMGLATAVKRLQASSATSKVVILLTDGRSNRGEIGPVTAAQMAQALGVRVYTIGAGSQGTARMPVVDPLRGTSYANVQVDIDEVSLQEIAELTGGQYFRATDTESLAQIWAQIDELETTEIEVQNYTQYEERFGLVLMFGFLMLGLELGLSSTVLRRLP
ncbi:MAG: VWA domain-containing protein [Gemmatimonadales bacterium]|jgi:Ca-activated chloride channel family protein|nr:VWA domain-containing protein [Gemmatimonadales bacterium]MDG2239988.1 VWA domain-containing protein [Longimicrobiales bacterium]MBT3499625.1 VWA domain-containing protein [Gemmatimonadales bacterium]MBT3776024.1 VWA domain-containing protein [Gemmatimonadales bacterium]MBT3959520.1 VWA domain-containing protein [Gemmatimonadales bacterium]